MTTTRSRNVFGFDTTVTVTVPDVVTMPPGMVARLEHHVEQGLASLARRIAWHVIDWPKRQTVLRRMPFADAETLGLVKEWRRAQAEKRP